MARFVLDIRDELDVPIIMVEHDMGLVMDLADRVLVVDFGTPDRHGHARRGAAPPRRGARLPRQRGGVVTSPVTRIRAHAESMPDAVALRDKHLGIWREWTWASLLGARPAGGPRLPRPRRRARRPGRDPLREPAGVAGLRHGCAGRPCGVGGRLSDEPRRRGGLPAQRLRGEGARRGGPGAGRQDLLRARPGAGPGPRRLPRAAGHPPPLRQRAAALVGGLPRARPRPPGGPPGRARRGAGPAGALRPRHADLHLRHHRPPEGGDAHRQQRRVRDRGPRRAGRLHRPTARAGGPHPVLPAAGPRRGADLLHLVQRRRGDAGQLRRVHRDGAGQPA